MRAIDADALKEAHGMKNDCADCDKELIGKSISCQFDTLYTLMDFCGWLDDAPTIEPERKTGKWSVEFSPAYKGGAYCECSQCNYKFAMGAYFEPDEWKFCPNCGTDMRGETE